MFDVVFYWMFGGLIAGLVVVCLLAYPDLKKDFLLRRKAIGGE
jgi:hypothetical protein